MVAIYILERIVHDSLGTTPFEGLYGTQTDLSRLRALGCKCWYLIPKEVRKSKLHPHSAEGRFVG